MGRGLGFSLGQAADHAQQRGGLGEREGRGGAASGRGGRAGKGVKVGAEAFRARHGRVLWVGGGLRRGAGRCAGTWPPSRDPPWVYRGRLWLWRLLRSFEW